MAKKPTEKQIKAEIEKLKKMKPNVRPYSMFGDDHHRAIEAEIVVLEERLTEPDDVRDRFEFAPENVRDHAEIAAQWLQGEYEGFDEKDKCPSDSWKSLLIKK